MAGKKKVSNLRLRLAGRRTHVYRLLTGWAAGTVVTIVLLFLMKAGSSETDWQALYLGNTAPVLLVGGLMGLGYTFLFHSRAADFFAGSAHGFLVGVVAWLVLQVALALVRDGSTMQVQGAAGQLPLLVAYLLSGGLIGLAYALAARALGLAWSPADSSAFMADPALDTRIVILGGGYAGVAAAETLERECGYDSGVGIWLVSDTNYLLHTPLLSEVCAGAVNAQHISPSLRHNFHHVHVIKAEVQRVDIAAHVVHLTGPHTHEHSLVYDHLVIALGSVSHFFGREELEAHSFTFKTLDDAVRLRSHVIEMFERANYEDDANKRRHLLTFVVAGGGLAGGELSGALNDFARGILPLYPNVAPDDLRLILVHSRETILPELSVSLGKYAQERLEERGVEFKLGTRVVGAAPGRVELTDEVLDSYTLIWTAGTRPNPRLARFGIKLTEKGQIAVNSNLASPAAPGLWAAGDCVQIPDPYSRTGFAPPTAQHAVREGKLVGQNIAATIHRRPLKEFRYRQVGALAVLGYQLAVAEIFGYRFSGFLAWLMWRTIYLVKLPTLEKQLRVALDWLVDIFFPLDQAQTEVFSPKDSTQKTRSLLRDKVDQI